MSQQSQFPCPTWLPPVFVLAILVGIGLSIFTMHTAKKEAVSAPKVLVEEKEGMVTFSVTSAIVGKHEAISLLHDKVFLDWNRKHPEHTLWQPAQKATMTITFELPKK